MTKSGRNLEKRFYVFKHVLDFGFIPIALIIVCGFTLKPPPRLFPYGLSKRTHTPSAALIGLDELIFLSFTRTLKL